MGSARRAAIAALEKCRRQGAWSDAVLGSVMDAEGLDARDRALCSRISYGVMQQRLYLDYYIDLYCTMHLRRVEPKVLDILRASAYQLLFMERIPPSAAVNEGVALCRSTGCARAAGMVNAVLRRLAENRDALPQVRAGSRTEELSIKYSTPHELTELLMNEYGDGTEALLQSQNEPAPVMMQVNTCRTDACALLDSLEREGVQARLHGYLPDCVVCDAPGSIERLEAFRSGWFYVQDAAAKMSVMALGILPGMRILDVCAAPGGKSFAAAAAAGGQAEIIACDLHENKLRRIESSAKRLGFDGIISTAACDGRVYLPEWENSFDAVICDVPCSGLGVIRKKPDIRYKPVSDFDRLPEIQLAILRNAARYVKPGGALMYSTCTVLRAENGDIARKFSAENTDFAPEDFNLPGGTESTAGQVQFLPHIHGTDGFFAAKFRRK